MFIHDILATRILLKFWVHGGLDPENLKEKRSIMCRDNQGLKFTVKYHQIQSKIGFTKVDLEISRTHVLCEGKPLFEIRLSARPRGSLVKKRQNIV